jgi:hypothetical protein
MEELRCREGGGGEWEEARIVHVVRIRVVAVFGTVHRPSSSVRSLVLFVPSYSPRAPPFRQLLPILPILLIILHVPPSSLLLLFSSLLHSPPCLALPRLASPCLALPFHVLQPGPKLIVPKPRYLSTINGDTSRDNHLHLFATPIRVRSRSRQRYADIRNGVEVVGSVW